MYRRDGGMSAVQRAYTALQRSGSAVLAGREEVGRSMERFKSMAGIDMRACPPIIHIAGTKGKGSTAAICESILRQAGLRTGLFTSPHLVNIRERFRLQGVPIDETTFLKYFWSMWDRLQLDSATSGLPPSGVYAGGDGQLPLPVPGFFHFLSLLAFDIFSKEAVDVAVMEVGIGGRLDATNIASTVAVCGITTLDFDHMDMLGPTLTHIAGEKAGIMKPGVPCVTVAQPPDAMKRIMDVAAAVGAPLFLSDPCTVAGRTGSGEFPPLSLQGDFQRVNAAHAIALTDIFLHRRSAGVASTLRTAAPMLAHAVHVTSAAVVSGCAFASASAAAASAAAAAGPDPSNFGSEHAPFTHFPAATSTRVSQEAEATLPPVYLNRSPLPRSTLAALASTRWSARAQTLRLRASDMKLCAATRGDGPPAHAHDEIAVYIDGAHTQKSMEECIRWFQQRFADAAAADTTSGREHEAMLLFYCGTDKESLQLLLPLSTFPFTRAVITSIPWAKPTGGKPLQSPAEMMSAFLHNQEEREPSRAAARAADDATATHMRLAAALASMGGGDGVSSKATGVATVPPAWLVTLDTLWRGVHCVPDFAQKRAQLLAHVHPDAVPLPSLPACAPPTVVHDSLDSALADVGAYARMHAATKQVHVLVTGSLYLAGAVLESVGWSEDAPVPTPPEVAALA